MSLENQESKEDERRQEDKKIEGADKLLKQEGKNADIAETAKRAGQNLSKEIENTRLDKAGSSGESEKAEYHRQSLPLLAKYEWAVREASDIKDPETRKKTIEKAYLELQAGLEGIRGTQEARDAKNDKDRQKEGEKTNDKQERKKTLEFSEAILKAAKDVDTERRVRELVELASKRMQMAERTETERRVSAEVAGRSLSEMA